MRLRVMEDKEQRHIAELHFCFKSRNPMVRTTMHFKAVRRKPQTYSRPNTSKLQPVWVKPYTFIRLNCDTTAPAAYVEFQLATAP